MKINNICFFIILSFVFFYTNTSAQKYQSAIKGRALKQSTGAPLENVNVYISGTTWGAATDRFGYFEINPLPEGIHIIVASIVGYDSETKELIIKENTTYQVEFKLKEATYELESVVVAAQSSKEWRRDFEIFKKRFLGETKLASDCIIENPEYINLVWISSYELRATTEKPIIIINNALGYKISCELVTFLWDTKSYQINFTIRPLFMELQDSTGLLNEKWIKNRYETYNGSIDQFLKSVINNSLEKSGFRIYINTMPSTKNKYENFLEQPMVRPYGDEYIMSFNDYLKVEYVLNDPIHPEISWIKLVNQQVTLDKFGYPMEQVPFEVYGFWAQKGLADMLPKYFTPNSSL